ncbi:MAG: hypothetical protein R2851_03610 [Caldilineaceae bacterium]
MLLLAFIPVLSVAGALITTLLTRVVPPSVLPKLDFSERVPASSRTMIVIPVLLTGKREIEQLLAQMEQHYLGNTDLHIDVGLLSDFADAAKETMSTDDGLLALAVNGVEALNRRHGGEPPALLPLPPPSAVESVRRLDGVGAQARQARRVQPPAAGAKTPLLPT